jgi:Porin subfamily
MRNTILAIVIALTPAQAALAGSSGSSQKPDKPANSGRLRPVKRAATTNSCAAYGPGFVKVDGTETCMKLGGAVSIGVGSSGGWH